jgi:hypothetical protein
MTHEECWQLLRDARTVLGRCMYEEDGETMRDDVAELCMKIDEAMPQLPVFEVVSEQVAA